MLTVTVEIDNALLERILEAKPGLSMQEAIDAGLLRLWWEIEASQKGKRNHDITSIFTTDESE